MKEYEVRFVTKKGGYREHVWYVRARDIKDARKQFDRIYYEEDKRTAHAFHVKIRLFWVQ